MATHTLHRSATFCWCSCGAGYYGKHERRWHRLHLREVALRGQKDRNPWATTQEAK